MQFGALPNRTPRAIATITSTSRVCSPRMEQFGCTSFFERTTQEKHMEVVFCLPVQQKTPVQDDDAWAGWVFLASISCHDSTCSMRAPSHVSRHTPPGPRKPTQQAKGVATATDRPKRGSLSLTEVKAVAPIHGLFFGFVFIAPITSAESRMATNTSLAH